MGKIKLYTRELCGWCQEAKGYLAARGIPFESIDVAEQPGAFDEMQTISGQRYVPTLVVDGKVLANFDVGQLEEFLKAMEQQG